MQESKMSSIRNDVYKMLAAVIFFGDKKAKKGSLFLILVFVNGIIHQVNLSNKLNNFTLKVE